ncbi:MAG TPA: DUF349 domain-containing protein, partial [Candidatus Omnitrophica bacterium]|nr:DUF349 domain-containing protein [Candidatus Omnitrophota bacterium]
MLDENEKIKSTDEEKITPEVSEENQPDISSDTMETTENKASSSEVEDVNSGGALDEVDDSKTISEKDDKEEKIEDKVAEEVEEEAKAVKKKKETVKEKKGPAEQKDEPVSDKKEKEAEPAQKEEVDYEKFDLEQLTAALDKLLKSEPVAKIKSSVDKIKTSFNQQFGALINEKKEAFLAEGGNVIDFYFSSPIKATYNDLLFEYKTKRESHYKQIEQEQKDNLTKRLVLIEDLKHLIENGESSTMYSHFRELQEKWRAIGRIPSAEYRDTWRTYEHHVERFYDLLHLSNDLRDLDFKHNLLEKI